MVPMADNWNHKGVDVTLELISVSLHQQGPQNPVYYRVAKYLNDYSPAFEAHGVPKDVLESINIKGRFNRKLYDVN